MGNKIFSSPPPPPPMDYIDIICSIYPTDIGNLIYQYLPPCPYCNKLQHRKCPELLLLDNNVDTDVFGSKQYFIKEDVDKYFYKVRIDDTFYYMSTRELLKQAIDSFSKRICKDEVLSWLYDMSYSWKINEDNKDNKD